MRAVTWQDVNDVRVETVPDPRIEQPTDAIISVTSSGICGSDLHLAGPMGRYMCRGDILGHEAIGIVEELGPEVTRLSVGDRVVVPFNIACGDCGYCRTGLTSQCSTTRVRGQGTGAAQFGYSALYGQVPGAQAEYLRVPQAQFGPVVLPHDNEPDQRYLFLSDILPTAWQAVIYAEVPPCGSVAVWGLGPVGQLCTRIAWQLGADQVFGIDRVPERLAMARRHGIHVIDTRKVSDVTEALRELTGGEGPDAVIDAVGMEAHGAPPAVLLHRSAGAGGASAEVVESSRDRVAALHQSIDAVRRGGTVSVAGVYAGPFDPLPMLQLFDKQLTMRFGQANVRQWVDEIMPMLNADDPLGVMDLVTHRLPLESASEAYWMFQQKRDRCIKVILEPGRPAAV
ncbi:zinc-dependent alcohol dehydrogenase [Microlunatus panaciterrae]|uniref:Threonine dehydrogenase-like Zn-dependent dehydrogenase n=1 Tax=Microlunatus panaciterrae TaxID=400768 RepID=A0ABS2RPJ5_9ACTN|nr:threonine dehydrogenase-like Zn-dependent dehydrogenase [Microlunatus panaciterrae]